MEATITKWCFLPHIINLSLILIHHMVTEMIYIINKKIRIKVISLFINHSQITIEIIKALLVIIVFCKISNNIKLWHNYKQNKNKLLFMLMTNESIAILEVFKKLKTWHSLQIFQIIEFNLWNKKGSLVFQAIPISMDIMVDPYSNHLSQIAQSIPYNKLLAQLVLITTTNRLSHCH